MLEKQIHLVIVTGMSGAGKTVAIQSFEDLGYFTIDNIPPTLVPKFLKLLETAKDIDKLALVVDMRSRSFFAEIQNVLDQVENNEEIDFKILFLDAADKEVENTQVRYEKFAEVQAWLTDSALFLPVQSGGANPIFRKTVPFTGAFSFVGHKGDADNYKYLELQKDPVTAKQYQELYEKWQKEKTESNKKAQEDLAKHVE